MKKQDSTFPRYAVLLLSLSLSLLAVGVALAAGNIDATNKWAWGTNVGWINFNPDNGGVTVFSDHLEGSAWGENAGWIRLGTCTNGSPCTYANTTASNYGVNNDGSGTLSGYAWGTNVGWINFAPTGGGVTINSATGDFNGYAWGENIGWIHFQNGIPAYKVTTTWHSAPTAVLLANFAAEAQGDAIRLVWETGSEFDLLGFNLARAESPAGPWTRLNTELIAAAMPESNVGYVYTWSDETVILGRVYWYQLSAVRMNNETNVLAITSNQLPAIVERFGSWLPLVLR